MPIDPRTPILVGVGQVTQHCDDIGQAAYPVGLMSEAIRLAIGDAGRGDPPEVDSIGVVAVSSWRYGDPVIMIGRGLGLATRETAATHGGNSPQMLVNHTASRISNGELNLVVLAGGEASRTRRMARGAGTDVAWPTAPDGQRPRSIGQI